MEALFLYFGKVIFTSGVMFLYYKLFLKDKTFHHYNRFYLLAAVVISLLLPLLKVSYFTLEVNSNMYLLINRLQNLSSTNNLNNDFNYFKIGAFLTGLVAVFFLSKLIFGLVKIEILKRKFSKEDFEGISFYQTDLAEAPFSFFKNLFWKNSIEIQSDLGRQILKHEMVHIEQKHSWDKIFLEITTSLFWFNPFFYLIKKEISLIHEYLADKKAVENSDTKAFAQMLLASHFSGKQLPATSPFLSSNLKKRLTMLKKSKTKFSYARRILALPLLFILAFMYLVNAKNKEIKITNQLVKNLVYDLKSSPVSDNNIEKTELKDFAFGTDGAKTHQEDSELIITKDTIKLENIQNSAEVQKRILEADKKAAEADQLVNSKEFKMKMRIAEKRAKEAEVNALKIEKKINSPEFKKKIQDAVDQAAEADKTFNSPEFQKKIEDAVNNAISAEHVAKASEISVTKFNPNITPPLSKMKFNDTKLKSVAAIKNLKYVDFKNSVKDVEIIAVKDFKVNSATNSLEDINVFIDGQPSTNDQMQKLNPNTIESMHVYKKGFEGKKKEEIHIKLKK